MGGKVRAINETEITRQARLLGFIGTKSEVTSLSLTKMDDFARKLVKKLGAKPAFSLFQARVVFWKRVRTKKGQLIRKKFERGRDTIGREFGKKLTS